MALTDWGIGVVGLGGIAQHHLEGYRRQGLSVVAGAELDPQRRADTQKRFGIPAVYASVEELVAREDVKIVDITVPHIPAVRFPVVQTAARAGKALFVQKPLMPILRDAKTIVEMAKSAGVPLMVNQNSLFVAGFRYVYDCLQDPDAIGTPYYCQIENRSWFDISSHPWFGKNPRWITSDMGVHHFALVYHWFGPVESVYAVTRRDPSQSSCVGENVSMVSIRFQSGVEAVVLNNWAYRGGTVRAHSVEEVVIQGDKGTLTASSVAVEVVAKDGQQETRRFAETWFPDAFGHSMRHFVECLDTGRAWWCEGSDNLHVIEIIEAAYRSAADRRVVAIDEVR